MFPPAGLKNASSNCLVYLNAEMKPEVQGKLNKIATHWPTVYDAFPRFLRQMKQGKEFVTHVAKQLLN